MSKAVYEKLGLRENVLCHVEGAPSEYHALIGKPPFQFTQAHADEDVDFIHLFTASLSTLEDRFPALKARLTKTGMLWVSWPKQSSKIPKDLNEDIIRETGLNLGLVDVKVCAVNEDWSALKFVYRLKDR